MHNIIILIIPLTLPRKLNMFVRIIATLRAKEVEEPHLENYFSCSPLLLEGSLGFWGE